MRIFVAGAAGVIGRVLVPELIAAGHEVWGTTRHAESAAWLESTGAHPVSLDIYDTPAVESAVADAAPDAIVHQLTALSESDRAANARIRTVATRTLVDAARLHGVTRMVAQSISFVYPPGVEPATEADPIDPARTVTLDGVRALESAVGELPGGVVLRYGTLYGPGTWYAHDGMMAEKARAGDLPTGDEVSCFLHVQDAAAAVLAALDWPPGIVNVVDDDPAPADIWVPAYARSVGAPAPTTQTAAGIGRPVSNARARALGWTPRYHSWRDGFVTANR
ncbi:NAD-dependent epimerase/dehydratase family protein [Rhodococcus sp. NPDC003322]